MKMLKSKKTLPQLIEEVATLLQKLVRMKAADEHGYCKCATCRARHHWKEMDGGHFISRRYQGTKLVEENIHPQCKRCNGWPDNFTRDNYEAYMIDMYGQEFVHELKVLARQVKKFTRDELEDMKTEFSKQIKERECGLI